MGPILVRIENLNTYLMLGGGAVDSLQLKLNAIEWMVYQEIYVGEPSTHGLSAWRMLCTGLCSRASDAAG